MRKNLIVTFLLTLFFMTVQAAEKETMVLITTEFGNMKLTQHCKSTLLNNKLLNYE